MLVVCLSDHMLTHPGVVCFYIFSNVRVTSVVFLFAFHAHVLERS